jgi:hypothetical protein
MPDSNFLIPTGRVSGLVALDIDMPDGFIQMQNLVTTCPEMLDLVLHGVAVRSPSGGLHIWLPYDGQELRSGPLSQFPQIEVKADRSSLTGPLTTRSATEKKCEGIYLPLDIAPSELAEFMQVPIPDGLEIETRTQIAPNLDIVRRVQQVKASPRRTTTAPVKAVELSRQQAQNWLSVSIDSFTQLPDGHQRASNSLIWTAVWLVSARFITLDELRANLEQMCEHVRYADNTPRSNPYPMSAIESVMRSVTNRVNDIIKNEPEEALNQMNKALRVASKTPMMETEHTWVAPVAQQPTMSANDLDEVSDESSDEEHDHTVTEAVIPHV